jgi:hypothetical protein
MVIRMKAEKPDTRHDRLKLEEKSIQGYEFLGENDRLGEPFCIGKGGSGIVYKVRQVFSVGLEEVYVKRAIKFFYSEMILQTLPNIKWKGLWERVIFFLR